MVDFPEDVIIDILLRLPSKSLFRSRYVSKYWNTLITSTSFIKAHLHRSSKPCHLLYQESVISKINLKMKTISNMKIRFSGCSEFTNLNPPPAITDFDFDNIKLVDSFNGIACLYAYNKRASTSRIWLWNPAINDCFALPEPPYPISSATYYCVGFGFNPLSTHLDDFKVVTITKYNQWQTLGDKSIEIYSRRTNSWKQLAGFHWFNDRLSYHKSNQVIFEEYICWSPLLKRLIGNIDTKTIMVSFNVATEEFREITIPDSIRCCGWDFITLLDGCVSLLVPYTICYGVWTMKEFGNIDSWSKLYNINAFSGPGNLRPLGFASTDEAIFLRYAFHETDSTLIKDMRSYDTRTRTFDPSKTIQFDFLYVDCCFALYMESLISVS